MSGLISIMLVYSISMMTEPSGSRPYILCLAHGFLSKYFFICGAKSNLAIFGSSSVAHAEFIFFSLSSIFCFYFKFALKHLNICDAF